MVAKRISFDFKKDLSQKLLLEWDRQKNLKDMYNITSKVFWICPLNHSYECRIDKRMNSNKNNCPYCQKQKLLSGFNDLATINKELLPLWDYEKNPYKPNEVFSNNKNIWWKCNKNHSFQSSANQLKNSIYKCPHCSGRKVIIGKNDLKTLYPNIAKNFSHINSIESNEIMPFSNKKYYWDCQNHREKYLMSPNAKISGRGCPYCSKPIRKILSGFNDLESFCIKNKEFEFLIDEWDNNNSLHMNEISKYSNYAASWICKQCSYKWKTQVYNRVLNGNSCPMCSKTGPSKSEKDFTHFIQTLTNEKIVENTRSIIAPYELDIYIPDRKLAIEFNGDYWHSDQFLISNKGLSAQDYHSIKLGRCSSLSITLLFIWESDWMKNRDEIITALNDYFESGSINPILQKLTNE